MPVELPWFTGVWRRTDLRIGGVLRDDADVLWLQAGAWYADLRIPHDDHGGPIEAFAGTARWVDPYFTWVHDLDWLGSYPDDVGHLEVDGHDIIERGTFELDGHDAPYEERWVRTESAHVEAVAPPGLVATGSGAVLVQVGDHAIVLIDERSGPDRAGGGFAASRFDRLDGQWQATFTRGIGIDAPDSYDPVSVRTPGDRLAVGARELGVEAIVGRSTPVA